MGIGASAGAGHATRLMGWRWLSNVSLPSQGGGTHGAPRRSRMDAHFVYTMGEQQIKASRDALLLISPGFSCARMHTAFTAFTG